MWRGGRFDGGINTEERGEGVPCRQRCCSCKQERPYNRDSTASRLLSEVKHNLARLVLRWGTTLEYLVLFFYLLLSPPPPPLFNPSFVALSCLDLCIAPCSPHCHIAPFAHLTTKEQLVYNFLLSPPTLMLQYTMIIVCFATVLHTYTVNKRCSDKILIERDDSST